MLRWRGLCGLALLAARVAEATGRLESGVSGRLLARLDVAATVIVVVAIAAAARPFVAAYLDRRNRPSYAAYLRGVARSHVRAVDPDRRRERGDGRPRDRPAQAAAHCGPVPRSAVIAADTGARDRAGVVRRRHRGARAARDRPDHRRAVPRARRTHGVVAPVRRPRRHGDRCSCSARRGRVDRAARCVVVVAGSSRLVRSGGRDRDAARVWLVRSSAAHRALRGTSRDHDVRSGRPRRRPPPRPPRHRWARHSRFGPFSTSSSPPR